MSIDHKALTSYLSSFDLPLDVSAMLISSPYNQSVVYPADVSEGAQVTIPASILQQVNATGKRTIKYLFKMISDV